MSGGLANVYASPPVALPGTRLIELVPGDPATAPMFDAIGEKVEYLNRVWEIVGFYLPSGRALGGVRAWLIDNFGITSFCNQRDLEVLMEIAQPGQWCHWLGSPYLPQDDFNWVGITAEPDDLQDDLLRLEWGAREEYGGTPLPEGMEITRHLHINGLDYEELLTLMWDADLETGMSPDPRLETVNKRWARVQLEKIQWR
jgi:hypothetical protein